MTDAPKTALLSVFNKTGIVEFAEELLGRRWEILASGGTCKALQEAGLRVRDVSELVGGGAILGHKVVTLSREIHAGLIADYEKDREEMEELGWPFIDLACVDMYPLQDEDQNPESTLESIRGKTDIGGPAMLRSAAKGQRLVLSSPRDRQAVLDWIMDGEPSPESFRNELAIKAEKTVSDYCELSSELLRRGGREINAAAR